MAIHEQQKRSKINIVDSQSICDVIFDVKLFAIGDITPFMINTRPISAFKINIKK